MKNYLYIFPCVLPCVSSFSQNNKHIVPTHINKSINICIIYTFRHIVIFRNILKQHNRSGFAYKLITGSSAGQIPSRQNSPPLVTLGLHGLFIGFRFNNSQYQRFCTAPLPKSLRISPPPISFAEK